MLLRARKLWKLVFLAACLVAVAVILSMWHIDKDEFEDDTNHGSIESDLHSANQRHVEEDKPTEQEHDYDPSDEFEVETNHGSIESDLHFENWQDVEEEKPTQQEHDNEDPTSENELYRAYDHMTTLLLFVGYSRSRHSLVSSLLDAHPHVIVADESYALRKWVQSPVWKTTKSKYDFFDTMMGSSVSSFKHGRRSRDTKGSAANLQIFGYNIPDQWQATYDRHIQV
ncbi:hypothetical protein OS493_027704 [Desmophyllum pertusum]|uniref:Sulfotransferase n=1 Tax=Desmophyllum pertusum TaxID=174260 RepID=A0A9W9Z9P5_9CNID|nr:hypothetical protein OS493_027704 [Desmophyllum pertusum]